MFRKADSACVPVTRTTKAGWCSQTLHISPVVDLARLTRSLHIPCGPRSEHHRHGIHTKQCLLAVQPRMPSRTQTRAAMLCAELPIGERSLRRFLSEIGTV